MWMRAWHATAADFDVFAPFSHFGTRAQAEMRCPPGGRLLEVEIYLPDAKTLKDRGRWSRRHLQRLQAEGYWGVRYLNRYEGIPLQAFDRAKRQYRNLDRLPDRAFRNAIPDAAESWIVFDPQWVRTIATHLPHRSDS